MKKINIFLLKKGRTYPLVKISFLKYIVYIICSILCSHITFVRIVLFHMFLWSNNFKWLVIPKHCKYYIADFMCDSSHCYQFRLWFTFPLIIISKYWIFCFSFMGSANALQDQSMDCTSGYGRTTALYLFWAYVSPKRAVDWMVPII